MASDPFIWRGWENGELPELKSHSRIKLEVLRQYVESYIEILFGHRYGAPEVELTLVDGFCGGGIYENNQPGSPLVLLQAVKTAEAKINQSRKNPLKIAGTFYFVDKDKRALDCLRHQLKNSEFRSELDRSIHLVHGCFSEKHHDVMQKSMLGRRNGPRTIFFLDQCGYSKVDMRLIPQISKAMAYKAEFIINLAITWMVDFINTDQQFRDICIGMGIGDFLDLEELVKIREEKEVNWHYIIESQIGPAVWKASQCPFYSPFYIKPAGTRRGYWLLHLAPAARARTAMSDVLWQHSSGTLHYGNRGLKMHEYNPNNDRSLYLDGFSLSDINRDKCINDLGHDVAELIRMDEVPSIEVGQLANQICNDTVANPAMLKDALLGLKEAGEISILGPSNGAKRGDMISDKDIIKINPQSTFGFFARKGARKHTAVAAK